MKNFLLLFSAVLLNSGCSKDDSAERTAPQNTFTVNASMYGHYTAAVTRLSPPSNYAQEWDIKPCTANSVWMVTNAQNIADSFIVEVSGSSLLVPSFSYPNPGWSAGTITISGNGTYSEPSFNLNIGQIISMSNGDTEAYSFTVAGLKQ